ncbi:MAG TPA: hypothetical protein VGD45_16155 [Steroidobacter sp.]|uniref:SecDF P1 head subdomain-containing protein n=1 Tax=Steroidobacter sp. TaxID=1978227 RepID=UPI002EDB80A9
MALAALLAFLLVGCARTPDVTLNLRVHTSDPEVVEQVRRIILFRFSEFRSSMFSSIESEVDGPKITFRFKGEAPEPSTVAYLYETAGRLKASFVGHSAVLFTDRDIEQANLAYLDERNVIQLRLLPEAGDRLHAITSRNVGKVARLTLDGRVLIESTVTAALRESLQIPSPEQDHERAMALVVVLRYGALPTLVTLVGRPDGA